MVQPRISIQCDGFDTAAETARLKAAGDVGAVVTFTGICRSDGDLVGLDLEHYPGMAEAEIARISQEALARWPLSGLTVIHRYGLMRPGDDIVLVASASIHRQAAFEAAEFVMDFLKSRAPFWKKEIQPDGKTGGWVDARDSDHAALGRWHGKI